MLLICIEICHVLILPLYILLSGTLALSHCFPIRRVSLLLVLTALCNKIAPYTIKKKVVSRNSRFLIIMLKIHCRDMERKRWHQSEMYILSNIHYFHRECISKPTSLIAFCRVKTKYNLNFCSCIDRNCHDTSFSPV